MAKAIRERGLGAPSLALSDEQLVVAVVELLSGRQEVDEVARTVVG